jgi:cytochrome c-type biogenesis protein CcmH
MKFLVSLCLGGLLAAAPVTGKAYRSVGERLICQCGCMQTVYGCNHYGCSVAEKLRKEVKEAIAATPTEDAALEVMVQRYGVKILVEPPKSGFSLSAWITPFAVLLGGALAISAVLRQWRRRHAAEALVAGPVDPVLLDRYAARIDEEIEKG